LPILSDIPILGILFASHQNTDFETQGSIFLVPSVVATVPVPAADLVDSAISGFRRYDGDFRDTGGLAPDGAAAAAAETKRAK
jgi:pilus assembly protein CpaC